MAQFYVKAPSINAVRRALNRAPGGVRVIGRHDRETIACEHTMHLHSYQRHWPIILERLRHHNLEIARPEQPLGFEGEEPLWDDL